MGGKRQTKERHGRAVKYLLCAAALLMLSGLLAAASYIPTAGTGAPPSQAQLSEELPAVSPPEEPEPTQEAPVQEPEPEEPQSADPDPDRPMIALTFDDGPGPYTERLLDAFAASGGRGSFFLVGRNIDAYPDTVRRAVAEGHELASHSWSHPQLTKLAQDELLRQLTATREKIMEVAGVDTRLVRPPYGSVNRTVKSVAAQQDLVLVTWSVDPRDWESRNADKVCDAILSTVQDGAIILCHDIHESTVEAMERLIPELQRQGYQLVTVTELLTSQGAEPETGKVYRERPEAPAQPEAPAETTAEAASETVSPETASPETVSPETASA